MSLYKSLKQISSTVNAVSNNNSFTYLLSSNLTSSNVSSSFLTSSRSLLTTVSSSYLSASQFTGSYLSSSFVTSSYLTASQITSSYQNVFQLTASSATISNNLICSGNVLMRSTYGIDFGDNTNAAGMTSELFNDYEEGTWTPAYSGSTTGGTAVGGTQVGYYTKVGRMVFINCFLSIGSWSTKPTGSIYISGLPFTINSSGFNYGAASATEFNSFATNFITILPKFEANSTVIGLIKTTAAATSQVTFLTGSDLSSATNQIIISGFYWT